MKNVVISGGSGYLGSVIARVLAGNGFNVISDQVDVTDEKKVKEYADKVKDQFGKVFAVIHAASSPLVRGKVLGQSNADFELQFKVNVVGAFNLFKYFCPIVEPDGALVGILSKAVLNRSSRSQSGSYIPAKYALRGLLSILSDELRESDVRVYGVAPAFMPGGLNTDIPPKVMELIEKKSSPDDLTTPAEVARVLLNLIEGGAKSASGKIIVVPGETIVDL